MDAENDVMVTTPELADELGNLEQLGEIPGCASDAVMFLAHLVDREIEHEP